MCDRRLLVLAGAAVLGVAGLVLTMATDDRRLAFTLGVRPTQVATVLAAGDEACQGPIDVPADAAGVEFQAGTFHGPGPPLEVTVRSAEGVLGRAHLAGGYPDNAHQQVRIDGITEGRRIAVCTRNRGSFRLALYGGPAEAARTSAVFVNGKRQNTDIALTFGRGESESMLSLLPVVFERAHLFHATWIKSWVFWMMAFLVPIAVPLMLMLALSNAEASSRPGGSGSMSARPQP